MGVTSGAPLQPRFPATPPWPTPPRFAGHAPSADSCHPRGPLGSGRAVGDAPCRLGVPDACGFLWEEAGRGHSAQLVASEALEGEIPPPLSDPPILPLPQGPNMGDLLNTPRIRKYGADTIHGT